MPDSEGLPREAGPSSSCTCLAEALWSVAVAAGHGVGLRRMETGEDWLETGLDEAPAYKGKTAGGPVL